MTIIYAYWSSVLVWLVLMSVNKNGCLKWLRCLICSMNIRTCTQAQTHTRLHHHAECKCFWHSQHTFFNHSNTSRHGNFEHFAVVRGLYASIHIVRAVTIRLRRKRHSQCTYRGHLCVSHLFVVTAHWFHNLVKEDMLMLPLRTLS